MKCETLNGILTFVLGVLVVLGVIFALKVVFITHDSRVLQSQFSFAYGRWNQALALYSDASAYNKKYPNPQMTQILQPFLQSIQSKPVNR